MTGRTRQDPHELFQLFFAVLGLRLLIQPFGLGKQPFPASMIGPLGILRGVAELHVLVHAVHQPVILLLRQLVHRRHQSEAEMFCDGVQILDTVPVEEVFVHRDGAVGERKGLVRNDKIRIEDHLEPKPVAGRTGPERTVEREHSRLELLEREAADRACHPRRVDGVRLPGVRIHESVLRMLQRSFDRIGQPAPVGRIDPVDDDLDVVHDVSAEFDLVIGSEDLSVDPHSRKSICMQIAKQLFIGPFLLADDRGEDRDHRLRILALDRVGDLSGSPRLDLYVMDRTVGDPDPCIQKPQVIIDLRHRPDGGTRIFRGGLLFDRYCGGEAFDGIDIRFAHQSEELAGVGGERLDISAVTFRIDRIKSESGFSRARNARHDDEFVTREFYIDILKVVLSCALHYQVFHADTCLRQGIIMF